MRTVVLGEPPAPLAEWLDQRRRNGQDLFDEVWEGVYHVAPAPARRHGDVDDQLAALLRAPARSRELWPSGPLNIGEPGDYRVPDRAYLRDREMATFVRTAAVVVEIVSPDDETYAKFDFYAARRVEEVIVVDPAHAAPWPCTPSTVRRCAGPGTLRCWGSARVTSPRQSTGRRAEFARTSPVDGCVGSDGVERDAVVLGCSSEVRADVGAGDGDLGTEGVRCGEGFDHRSGQPPSLEAMPVLELGHRPGEVAQVQNLDLGREGHEPVEEPRLLVGSEVGHGRSQLAGSICRRPGAVQSEQPQSGRGDSRCETTEIGWPFTGEDVTQEMVVDDDDGHYVVARSGSSRPAT